MIKFLQKVLAKIINSRLVNGNPYIDFENVNIKINSLKIKKCLDQVVIGENSSFYEQAEVFNLQKNNEKIKIGINTHVRGVLLLFANGGKIVIGDNSYIGFGTQIWSANQIIIGKNVLISHNCNIIDTNTHEENYIERKDSFIRMVKIGHPTENVNVNTAPIIIEDYVWINCHVSILKGVTIGEGAIIGAGAVVTKNVEPFTFVAGNPAEFIKHISK